MAKLFIPQVGNQLKLSSNWDCKVFNESRNEKVFQGLNIDISNKEMKNTNIDITFPKGTVLTVSRLYVRAPASSFDSITFTISECPIKGLNKARFWVKLMDANNIEFEEITIDMDSHKKLKDLYRFVALKNNFQNSERLSPTDATFVAKEIYDHHNKLNNNSILLKMSLSPNEFINTIQLDTGGYYHSNQDKNQQRRNEALETIKQHFSELEVSIQLLSVLDGWIVHLEENPIAIAIDKALGIYGKIDENYWRTIVLGSMFSRDYYATEFDKKYIPGFAANRIESQTPFYVEYQGSEVKVCSMKDFDKLVKSARSKPKQ